MDRLKFTHLTALMPCRNWRKWPGSRAAEPAERDPFRLDGVMAPHVGGDRGPGQCRIGPPPKRRPKSPRDTSCSSRPAAEGLLPPDWLRQAGRGRRGGAARCPPPRRNARRRPATARRRPARRRPRSRGRFPGLGVLPPRRRDGHLAVAIHDQSRRVGASNGNWSRRPKRPAVAMPTRRGPSSKRPSICCTRPASITIRANAHLLDLTAVAETTLGASFRDAIRVAAGGLRERGGSPHVPTREPPALRAACWRKWPGGSPTSLALLRQALDAGTAAIVGGEFHEVELPLAAAGGHPLSTGKRIGGLPAAPRPPPAGLRPPPLRYDARPCRNPPAAGVHRRAACDARRWPLSGRAARPHPLGRPRRHDHRDLAPRALGRQPARGVPPPGGGPYGHDGR